MTRVEGIDYSPKAIDGIRDEVIIFRDEALRQQAFSESITLSWVIAYLAEYREMVIEWEAMND